AGKIRLALCPKVNHWWNVTLYVTPRGLSTLAMPYGARAIEILFDFVEHKLVIQINDGTTRTFPLVPRSVAAFYEELMAQLRSAGVDVKIWKMPVEIPDPVPFDKDTIHASYDPQYAHRFWQILISASRVFEEFRARFIGKVSPVHFFWGSFDLAVTRFSGRRAPERKGADAITLEAYSHEVISAGFWPGGGAVNDAAFYSYAAPEPPGFSKQRVSPESAYYHSQLGEFILMYEDVRRAESPTAALLEFLQSTYAAGATLGNWDRASLERSAQRPAAIQ
ncbi:MAG TPA: DUF5996 family protein, partial [Terriglobia bacterium]|nr:DUF5996 family protein [Terriglobia bacterium]